MIDKNKSDMAEFNKYMEHSVKEDPVFLISNYSRVKSSNYMIYKMLENATPEDIDTAMKLGANHPMGPLALGDLIGWDVCLAIMEVLYNEFADSKYRPHPLMRKLVRSKQLGRKSGKGIYQY